MIKNLFSQKPKNQFAGLPEADRKLILDLCSHHDYAEVVEILRKPRSDGGLNLVTSRAALCRFYTHYNPEPSQAVLAQIAAAANIRHELDSNAFLGAIRATVQARVLQSLRDGKPFADLTQDLRFLRTTEHLYLADAKFRAQYPKVTNAAFKSHLQRCADAPEADFVRADDAQPDLASIPPDLSEFDRELIRVRQREEQTLALLETHGLTPEDFNCPVSEIDPSAIPIIAKIKSRSAQYTTSVAAQFHAKSPAIPHIPGNSTSRVPQNSTYQSNPVEPAQTAAPTKPKPHIAPPKPGRNDPCPCGSGRKSKKCCHQ
ncbi:MAG TPA: SEC-C metal-binding domain-containing protein [Verrucomicrobiae bacterium]